MHRYAYSIREHLTYSAARPVSPVTFRSHVFQGVKIPKHSAAQGKKISASSISTVVVWDVRVTCLERTFVDVLDRPDLSGSWEEVL